VVAASPAGLDAQLQTEPADALLVPAQVVGQLVPQRLLHLPGQQRAVVAEVPFERVAVDNDSVLVAFGGDPVAEVLAVGPALEAEIGDDDRHPGENALELLRESVDRVSHEGLEAVRLGLIHCRTTLNSNDLGANQMSSRLRTVYALFAVLALAAAGAAWSGCGSSDDETGTVREQAETQVEEGTKTAEEAIDEGVEKTKKGLEEAKEKVSGNTKKKIEKAQKEAEKGLEEGQAKAEKGLEEAKEQAEKYLP